MPRSWLQRGPSGPPSTRCVGMCCDQHMRQRSSDDNQVLSGERGAAEGSYRREEWPLTSSPATTLEKDLGVTLHRIGMRDGRVTSELGPRDTNGILLQPWIKPERTSAGLGWDKQYLSVQRERPYRESFAAADTHLVILHRDGPVTVRRGQGKLSRSRQVPAGGLFIHPAGRDLTVELGGALSTVHLYLSDDLVQDAAGRDRPVELAEELGTSDRLLEQLVLSMDETLRRWEPAARTYLDQLA